MAYSFDVGPELLSAVQRGRLSPSDLPDSALALLGSEFARAQEELFGVPDETNIPLPMPNLVYLLAALLERECKSAGGCAGTWLAFRVLAELQREVEHECINRHLNLSPRMTAKSAADVMLAALK